MKKILVAIIAFLYMGLSSGIAMDVHFCMGKKAGVDFYGDGKEKCSKCGMKPKKGKLSCCHDQHKFYKINDSHKNVSNDISAKIDTVAIVTTFYNHFFYKTTDAGTKAAATYPPPDYTKPQLYITNSVFRL